MTTIDFSRLDMVWRRPECHCKDLTGSTEECYEVLDSRGIYITRGCETCLPDKLKGYRADVLYGPTYEVDEPIEPEEY